MMAQYLVQQQLQFVADCERRYADKLLRTISKLNASKSSNVELLPSAAEMTQPPPVVEELPKAGADKQGTETARKSPPPRDVQQQQASSDFIPEEPGSGQQQEVKDMTESKSEPKPEELTTARRSSSRESSATEPRDVHQQASNDFIPEEPTSGQQQEVKDMTKASSEPKPEDQTTARRSSSREFSATEPGDEEEVNEAKEAERDEEAPFDKNVVEEEQYEEQATEKVQGDEQQLEEEGSFAEEKDTSTEFVPDEPAHKETKPSKQDNNLKTAISSASPQKHSLPPAAAKQAMELIEEEEEDEEREEPDEEDSADNEEGVSLYSPSVEDESVNSTESMQNLDADDLDLIQSSVAGMELSKPAEEPENTPDGFVRRRAASPTRNAPSRWIHIQIPGGLKRPYTQRALLELLGVFGTVDEGAFWIDSIKSNCIVAFETAEGAQLARESLHNAVWPTATSEPLRVKLSSEEKLNRRKAEDQALAKPHPPMNHHNAQLGMPKGLRNLHNTCYYNAAMQCLLNTAPLGLYLDSVIQSHTVRIPAKANYLARMGEHGVEAVEAEIQLDEIQFGQANDQMAMLWELKKFHEDYKSPGSRFADPYPLLNQIRKRARTIPNAEHFELGQQHDAHELLRFLLAQLREDEIERFQSELENHCIYTGKFFDNERLQAILQGPARPTLDAVFGGQMQQTTHCTHCQETSVSIEPFFDLSLPLHNQSDQPDGKPVKPMPTYKEWKALQEAAPSENGQAGRKEDRKKASNNSTATAQTQSNAKLAVEQCSSGDLHKQRRREREEKKRQNKARKAEARKNKLQQQKRQKSASLGPVSANGEEENKSIGPEEEAEEALAEAEAVPTLSDANILELFTTPPTENGLQNAQETRPDSAPQNGHEQKEEAVEKHEEQPLVPVVRTLANENGAVGSASGEMTVLHALGQYTREEVQEDYKCGQCKKQKAIRRLLILTPPLILTLHLKRFVQTARSTKKSNVFVGFDPLLDLGPFSSDNCKRIQGGQQNLLYSLYGIVQHIGDMRSGHYIAYVRCGPKMNPKRLEELFKEANAHDGNQTPTEQAELLEQKLRELKLTNGLGMEESGTKNAEPGLEALLRQHADNWHQSVWYECDDKCITLVDEKVAMKARAFLLFYERIF